MFIAPLQIECEAMWREISNVLDFEMDSEVLGSGCALQVLRALPIRLGRDQQRYCTRECGTDFPGAWRVQSEVIQKVELSNDVAWGVGYPMNWRTLDFGNGNLGLPFFGPELSQFFLDSSVFKIREDAESKCNGIGELRPADQQDRLHDLLLDEAIDAKSLDIVRTNLGPISIQLGAKIKQSLVGNVDLCVNVVDRDLLRFGTFNSGHAHHFAVGRHAVCAEVGSLLSDQVEPIVQNVMDRIRSRRTSK